MRHYLFTSIDAVGDSLMACFLLSMINRRDPDEYAIFNSKIVIYHDDTNDYVTNEPAIDYQCGALFTLTYYAP